MTSVNKNTWHYHLATVYGDFSEWKEESDFCSYSRQVIKGFLMTFVAIGLGTLVGVLYLDLVLWSYFSIITGHMMHIEPPAFIALVASVLMIGAIAWYYIKEYINDWRFERDKKLRRQGIYRNDEEAVETPPGYFKLLYMKFNEKVCVNLKFE